MDTKSFKDDLDMLIYLPQTMIKNSIIVLSVEESLYTTILH